MSGFIDEEKSLSTGIPDRNIGPETGSHGNATMTNRGDTSQGTNQDHESAPAPASGLGQSRVETSDIGERRSFTAGPMGSAAVELPQDDDVEPVYQQIADGGDRFDRDKRLNEDDGEDRARLERQRLEHERIERDRLGRDV